MRKHRLEVERLESRLAPAGLFHFTDVDGDIVTVNISKGQLSDLNNVVIYSDVNPLHPRYIRELDFTAAPNPHVFAGANITVSVVRGPTGDGFTYVGWINAEFIDLGAVTIHGDLGKIQCGDGGSKTDALKSLHVQSLGRFGTNTGAPNLFDAIDGRLGSLVVKGDVRNADVSVIDSGGGHRGSIGSIKIGGSLTGGAVTASGSITAADKIGPVKIGGSMIGGTGIDTGRIFCNGNLAGVTIGRDLIGSKGTDSGEIETLSDLGPVKIGGSIIGGLGTAAGRVRSNGSMGLVSVGGDIKGGGGDSTGIVEGDRSLAGVTVGGSLFGGTVDRTGEILGGTIGSVLIHQDVHGGDGAAGGLIFSITGRIGAVTIGGSIYFGSGGAGGVAILSAGDIGAIKVGGNVAGGTAIISPGKIGIIDVTGSMGGDPGFLVQIAALGKINPTSQADSVAIGRVTVGGNVISTQILAGYDATPSPINADASIGTVKVGGDWIASDLIAGIKDGGDGYFGGPSNLGTVLTDDTVIPGGSAAILAKIASITIGGQVIGTPGINGDNYAFAAEQIGAMNIGGAAIALKSGPHNDVFDFTDPNLSDVTIEEL
jgi:hypothetical protein